MNILIFLAVVGGTVLIDTASGIAQFIPTSSFTGVATFSYEVCDKSTPLPANCASAMVSVNVIAAPLANPDTNTVVIRSTVISNVVTNDYEGGAGPLRLSSLQITAQSPLGTATANTVTGDISFVAGASAGTAVVSYSICDSFSPTPRCTSSTLTILIAGPPTAIADSVTTSQGQSVSVRVLDNDTPGNTNVPSSALNPRSLRVFSLPTDTTASVFIDSETGILTVDPAASFTGPFSFSYSICDFGSPENCATATVSVQVDAGPTAFPDAASTTQTNPVTLNVLANDVQGNFAINPRTLAVLTDVFAINGRVEVELGSLTFFPSPTFEGIQSLNYQICDTRPVPLCSTSTVRIVVAGPPVVFPDTATTSQNRSVVISVLLNDESSNAAVPTAALNPASVTISVPPNPTTEGSVLVDQLTGNLIFVPVEGLVGATVEFQYTVCDSSTTTPLCASSSVTVTVQAGPTAVPDFAGTTKGLPIVILVTENDLAGDNQLDLAQLTIVPPGPNQGSAVTNGDGGILFTPADGFVGTALFSYSICDTANVCRTALVTIVVAGPPVLEPDTGTTFQGVPVDINIVENDRQSNVAIPNTTLDYTTLRLVGTLSDGSVVFSSLGVATFTPGASFTGLIQFIYELCDSNTPVNVCSQTEVNVEVLPTPTAPIARDDVGLIVLAGNLITIPVLANDFSGSNPIDPTSVTYGNSADAMGLISVDPSTGNINFTPNSDYSGLAIIVYTVCDTSSSCSSAAAEILVLGPPLALADFIQASRGSNVILRLLENDMSSSSSYGPAELNPASVSIVPGTEPDPLLQGTITFDTATGDVQFFPVPSFTGLVTLRYSVCDGGSPANCAQASASFSFANGPTAVDDITTIEQGGTASAFVLDNDFSGTAQRRDTENDPQYDPIPVDSFSLKLLTDPASIPGVATVDTSQGLIEFQPNPNFFGTVFLVYEICDSLTPAVCSQATWQVIVMPLGMFEDGLIVYE